MKLSIVLSRFLGVLGTTCLAAAIAWGTPPPDGECIGNVTYDGTYVLNCGAPCASGCLNVPVSTPCGSGFACGCSSGSPNRCCQVALVGGSATCATGDCGTDACPTSGTCTVVGKLQGEVFLWLPWCL